MAGRSSGKRVSAGARRSAQAQTQIFMYVLGAIVFVMVLIYGYKSISEIKDKGQLVEILRARNDLDSKVKALRTEYQTVRYHTLLLPPTFTKVCFIDSVKAESLGSTDTGFDDIATESPAAAAVVDGSTSTSRIEQNVFLTPAPSGTPEFYISNMRIFSGASTQDISSVTGPYWFCMPTQQGRIELKMTGLGKYVRVEPAEGWAGVVPTP